MACILDLYMPNGLAQRQRRDRQDSLPLSRHFWQSAPYHQQSRCPLQTVLGDSWELFCLMMTAYHPETLCGR